MPSEATSTLTIAGTSYGASGTYTRGSRNLILDALTVNYDGTAGSLAFSELGGGLAGGGLFAVGQSCSLAMAPVTYTGGAVFGGEIVDKHTDFVQGIGVVHRYAAQSFEYLAGRIPVTNAIDDTGLIRYNLRRTDEGYDATQARLEVGTIVQRYLDGHMTQLNAVGITGYHAADLTPLTVVPPTPVILRGANMWVRLLDLLRDWHGKYLCYIDPTGLIRIVDMLSLAAITPTIGTDLVGPPQLRRSASGCASRVLVRGQDIREIAYLSEADGTLLKNYTSADEAGYSYTDFSQPAGSYDHGVVTAQTANSFTYQSDFAGSNWGVDFLSNNGASVMLINDVATGITGFEQRSALSNTALVAGGTCTINVDFELANVGYTKCAIAMVPLAKSKVFREFVPANAYVAAHMNQYSHFPFQWVSKNQVIQTTQATGVTVFGSATWPMPLEVDATNGVIRAYEPIVKPWNTMADLNAGGSNIHNIPQDVQVAIPFTVGVLAVAYPADTTSGGVTTQHFAGTLFTEDGKQLTATVDVPTWIWAGDRANMAALAQSIWETLGNTVVEGTIPINQLYDAALNGPRAVNLASTVGTTGMETMAIPCRSVSVRWLSRPGGGATWGTTLYVSNRRRRNHGDAYYIHPGFLQAPFGGFGSVAGEVEGQRSAGYGSDPFSGGGFNS